MSEDASNSFVDTQYVDVQFVELELHHSGLQKVDFTQECYSGYQVTHDPLPFVKQT